MQTAIDQADPNILLAADGGLAGNGRGAQTPTCCSPSEALAWVNDLGDAALEGDPDARRC